VWKVEVRTQVPSGMPQIKGDDMTIVIETTKKTETDKQAEKIASAKTIEEIREIITKSIK
jgi:hypothetical protein